MQRYMGLDGKENSLSPSSGLGNEVLRFEVLRFEVCGVWDERDTGWLESQDVGLNRDAGV